MPMSTVHPTSSHIRILLAEEDETTRVFLAVIWRCCGASSTVAEPSLAGVIRGVI
jgi:hypothetical protein